MSPQIRLLWPLTLVVLLLVLSAHASATDPLVQWITEKHETSQDSLGAFSPVVSEDGQVVAFTTPDSGFVDEPPWPDCSGGRPGLHLPCIQVVVHSPQTTCRVSGDFNGEPLEARASFPSMSRDGSIIAFKSHAPDVVENDNNGIGDAFVVRGCGTTPVRVTVTSDGQGARAHEDDREDAGHPCRLYCPSPHVSPDGSTVVYTTWSSNLDPPDENDWSDVFVHNLDDATTTAITRTPAGETANGPSYLSGWAGKAISGDASRVVFISSATNLVADDVPACPPEDLQYLPSSYELHSCNEAYLYDESTGGVEMISKNSDGTVSPRGIPEATISGNGEYVFFSTEASIFFEDAGHEPVPGLHIYRKELSTGNLDMVALALDGTPSQGTHYKFTASNDGQKVAFMSNASDLVPDDDHDTQDVFVRDMESGQTWIASVDEHGEPVRGEIGHPEITLDGESLMYFARPDGVVSGDTNGVPDLFLVDLVALMDLHSESDTEQPAMEGTPGVAPMIVVAIGVAYMAIRRRGSAWMNT